MRIISLVCLFMGIQVTYANSRFDSATMRRFTDQDGLPQNSIKCIAPDKDGFIWMTTEDGLVRFDGYHFLNYSSVSLPIHDNHFLCILPTKTGLTAISMANEVIEIKDGKAALSGAFNYDYIDCTDTAGAYTAHGLPDYYLNVAPVSHYIFPVNNTGFYKVSKDSIEYFNDKKLIFRIACTGIIPDHFFVLHDNLYAVGSDGIFWKIDRNGKHALILKDDLTTNIKKHKNFKLYWNIGADQLFVAIDSSLYFLKIDERAIQSDLLLEGFSQIKGGVSSVYYDTKYQRLFIGSPTKGLFVYTKNQFAVLKQGGGYDEVYYAQTVYHGNSIVVPRGYLFNINGENKEIPFLREVGRRDNYTIATDRTGNHWYKDGRKLMKLDTDFTTILWDTTFSTNVNQLYCDNNDLLWIGNQGTGLYNLLTTDEHPNVQAFGTMITNVTYFTKTDERTLWVGTGLGLYRVDVNTGKTTSIPVLQDSYIRSLFAAPTGELWITTYKHGIFIYKNNELTDLPLDRRKYLLMAHCVIRDNKGYNWITTNKGLFQISTNDVLSFVEGKRNDLYYLYYRKEQGFNTNEFNGGCQPCAVKLDNGDISLPSLDGLVYFTPNNIIPELPDKRIFIDQIEIDTTVLPYSETIKIPHSFHHARLRISSPYFGDPDNLYFYYSLEKEGDSEEALWLPVNSERLIEFSSLNSGTYHLRIRKSNGFGDNNEREQLLVIEVSKAFYETIIFRIALVLFIMLGIFAFFRFREKRMAKKNEQLQMLVAERTGELNDLLKNLQTSEQQLRKQSFVQQRIIAAISHDLKTPMKYLMQVVGTSNEPILKEERAVIHDSLHNMYYLVENLIQYIRSQFIHDNAVLEMVDLYKELEVKASIFRPVALSKKVNIYNNTTAGTNVLVNKQLLAIIIHNLIDNAVKNTPAGSVTLFAAEENGKIRLTFSDTGIGMPQVLMNWINQENSSQKYQDVNVGIGLLMVMELLALINGRIEAARNGLHGAIVTITLDTVK